jgi:hypothetical protein
LCGAAPVTRRSGKSHIVVMRCGVVMRYAANVRLRNAVYHWARIATQHDPKSRPVPATRSATPQPVSALVFASGNPSGTRQK